MTTYTAQTVRTQFAQANGIRFAYRRWGKQGGPPLASISTEGFYPSVRMQIWQNRPVSYLFR